MDVDETPHEVVHEENEFRVLRHDPLADERDRGGRPGRLGSDARAPQNSTAPIQASFTHRGQCVSSRVSRHAV